MVKNTLEDCDDDDDNEDNNQDKIFPHVFCSLCQY